MILGDYYQQPESKHIEFKEFYLKVCPDTILTDEEIVYIVNYGKFFKKLNHLIFLNIKSYLIYYLPKYMSCFLNSQINGKLILGVNDFGEITGIPYSGSLSEKKIFNFIDSYVSKYVNGIDKFENYINLNIIRLDKDLKLLDDEASDLIDLMNYKNNLYFERTQKFNSSRKKWIKILSKYNTKLINILNSQDTKKELIEFVKLNSNNLELINKLESIKEFQFLKYTDFFKKIKNKNEILYWVAKFKDFKIDELQKIKPKRIETPSLLNNSMILSKLSHMRYRFTKNNKNLNYYLIEISINCKSKYEYVHFKSPNSNDWIYRIRIDTENGPSCI